MKGVIVIALKELVVEKFGLNRWNEILKGAGIEKEPYMTVLSDIDDKIVLDVLKSLCRMLGMTSQQAADAFGEYWMTVYAPKHYQAYFLNVKNAKEFLLKMDQVHVSSTKTMKDARPPRFQYEWKDNRTLIMTYISKRGLMDIFEGLVKGVARYYKEDLKIRRVGTDKLEIVFPY